jgi:hypothetical protein
VPLPAGSWWLELSGRIDTTTTSDKIVACSILADDRLLAVREYEVEGSGQPASRVFFAIPAVVTLAQRSDVVVRCGGPGGPALMNDFVLRAIGVETITR